MRRRLMVLAPMLIAFGYGRASAQAGDTLRLGLSDVVRIAAERSAEAEIAGLAVEEGEAELAQERSELLPHLGVDFMHGARTFNTASFGLDFPTPAGGEPLFDPDGEVVGPVTTVDVRARVAQTLFDWSAIRRVRAARAALAADRSATETARERAAAAAAAAWVRARQAEGRLAASSADVALSEELLAIARGFLEAGTGVRLDVTRAEAHLASMRAAFVSARAESGRTKLALLRALDLPLDRPVAFDMAGGADDAARDASAAAGVDATQAVAQRAEVAELDRRIEAARLAVEAIAAERWPTVTLGAGDGFTGGDYSHLLNTYEWALRVSVPVFDTGRGAREDAGRARAEALAVRRRELAARVEFEVRDAVLRFESANELVTASARRLELAQSEYDQAQSRFRAGVAGSADVFTASLRLNEARSAAVDAQAALDAARVTLAIAQGDVLGLR